jgi:DNA-binding GntR family transcriptional regulator
VAANRSDYRIFSCYSKYISHNKRDMTLTKLPATAVDRVSDGLREMIVSGELAAGARLVQRKLAAQFGTSSIPVIEAIRRLEREGLVQSHPNFGATVAEWNDEDIEGIFLMRVALEGVACRLFAERAKDMDLAILREYSRQFDECTRQIDAIGCTQADLDFHLQIVKAAQCPTLARAVEQSASITRTIQNSMLLGLPVEQLVGPVGAHEELIAALAGRDADAAEKIGRKHAQGGCDYFMANLHRKPGKRA